MALKLKLVLTPTLRLAFKALLVGASILALRTSHFNPWQMLIFFALFSFFYLRPAIGAGKFLASAAIFIALIFSLPVYAELELFISALGAVAFYLLVSVKNLVYIRRENFYNLLQSIFILGISFVFLSGLALPITFLLLILLGHEFYSVSANLPEARNWLISGIGAFLITQTLWIINFLPLSPLLAGSLVLLTVLIFYDLSLRHLEGSISSSIALRDASIFVVISTIILLGARWTL